MTRYMHLYKVACLTLIAACTQAMAAADPTASLVSSRASLEGLSYRLIDLAPDDGITPYVLIDEEFSQTFSHYSDGDQSVTADVEGPFFGGPSFTRGNEDGTVGMTRTGDSMAGHSSIRVADLSRLNDVGWLPIGAPPGTTTHGVSTHMTNNFSGTSEAFWEREWILSPNTALVLEATATMHGGTDLGLLSDTGRHDQVKGSAYTTIALALEPRQQGLTTSGLPYSFRKSISFNQTWTDGLLDGPAAQENFQQFISLRLDNTSNDEAIGSILSTVTTSAYMIANPAPVPEPAAGLMMCAGLAALGWHARKRRVKTAG